MINRTLKRRDLKPKKGRKKMTIPKPSKVRSKFYPEGDMLTTPTREENQISIEGDISYN